MVRKKIIVIGCPGSGKSTFCRRLHELTGIELFHLDMLYFNADRTIVEREVFMERLNGVLERDSWIIDGNYLRTMPLRLSACDAVFFFDIPLEQCLEGAASRIGTVREDLPWTEKELDPEFRQYIIDFPKDQLPVIRRLLKDACGTGSSGSPSLIAFTARDQADEFIRALRSGRAQI